MNSKPTPLSTFDRSCQHWSEQGREGMDAFYQLASKDYRELAEGVRWADAIAALRMQFDDRLSVLDVACGSGQFPSALQQFGGWGPSDPAVSGLRIPYSLLDPSQFSIDTAGAKLRPPFEAADSLLCTAQTLEATAGSFPIVWATHALYCVPADELDVAIERMLAVTAPKGLGFIAHASESAHYLRFHDEYLRSRHSSGSVPYCTGEQVLASLRRYLPADQVFAHAIEYDGTVGLDDHQTTERYLQRCLFDDDLTLEQMIADDGLGGYLERCHDLNRQQWRFHQRTWMIFYGPLAGNAERWIRGE